MVSLPVPIPGLNSSDSVSSISSTSSGSRFDIREGIGTAPLAQAI
jgi:hypothetical protein